MYKIKVLGNICIRITIVLEQEKKYFTIIPFDFSSFPWLSNFILILIQLKPLPVTKLWPRQQQRYRRAHSHCWRPTSCQVLTSDTWITQQSLPLLAPATALLLITPMQSFRLSRVQKRKRKKGALCFVLFLFGFIFDTCDSVSSLVGVVFSVSLAPRSATTTCLSLFPVHLL